MGKVLFKKMFLIMMSCILVSICGCGSKIVTENNADADQNEPNELKENEQDENAAFPYYYDPKAFSENDTEYFNKSDKQMVEVVDSIRPELGEPLEWEFLSTNMKVYMYLQDKIPLFIIEDDQVEYQFMGAKITNPNVMDPKQSLVRMNSYDLTGDDKEELVITYPRKSGGTGFSHYGIMIIDLDTHKEIKAFQDGEDWTNFTPEQAQQVNTMISQWNTVNNDFSWYTPLQGVMDKKPMELDVFGPRPRQLKDEDALVVGTLFDPTHNDPVSIDVKMKYIDGKFQVDDMAVTSWRKYDKVYKELKNK